MAEQDLASRLVIGWQACGALGFGIRNDDYVLRSGTGLLRALQLSLESTGSLDEAVRLWKLRVRSANLWRVAYDWLSHVPPDQLVASRQAVLRVRSSLEHAGRAADCRAAGKQLADAIASSGVPGGRRARLEEAAREAGDRTAERWEAVESAAAFTYTELVPLGPAAAAAALARGGLRGEWLVLKTTQAERRRAFELPDHGFTRKIDEMARRMMEVLDVAGQMPPPGRLYGAAHEFEKYPRLLARLIPADEHADPFEALDLWFAKLLRELQYANLANMYFTFEQFRLYCYSVGGSEFVRLTRHIASASVVFAFQYAFQQQQVFTLRGLFRDGKVTTSEAQLLPALAQLSDGDLEAAVRSVAAGQSSLLREALRQSALKLLKEDERDNDAEVAARERILLDQLIRLGIFQPSFLQPGSPAEQAIPAQVP